MHEKETAAMTHFGAFGIVNGVSHNERGWHIRFERLRKGIKMKDVPTTYEGEPVTAKVIGRISPL